jgi:hypothetical protein
MFQPTRSQGDVGVGICVGVNVGVDTAVGINVGVDTDVGTDVLATSAAVVEQAYKMKVIHRRI